MNGEHDEIGGKIAVSAEGIELGGKAKGAFSGIGSLGQWLFQDRSARAKISNALAESLSSKIQTGESLNENERLFAAVIFRREATAILNQVAITHRAEEVLPEVARLVSPESDTGSTTGTFANRARAIAGEIEADELRDLFARVCAGEFCRPGEFSVRTLEVIRALDPNVAKAFRRYRATVVNGWFQLAAPEFGQALVNSGLTIEDLSELRDAGLTDNDVHLVFSDEKGCQVLTFGDRQLRITCTEPRFFPGNLALQLASSHLTRVGRELSSVLPLEPNIGFFNALGWHLTMQLNRAAAVEWSIDGDNWQAFQRDPPAVVEVISYGKDRWILGRDPRTVYSDAITGDPNNPGVGRVVYRAFWGGAGWMKSQSEAKTFESQETASDYFRASRESIERCP